MLCAFIKHYLYLKEISIQDILDIMIPIFDVILKAMTIYQMAHWGGVFI